MTAEDRLATALSAAHDFVTSEAGFAQVTTLGATGFPTARTASAFLAADWSVHLVQRAVHRRLDQMRHNPRVLITWTGTAAEGSRNEAPAVFDLGLRIPRAVFVQGVAVELDASQTWDAYTLHDQRLRESGRGAAPVRDRADVAANLAGFVVRPRLVRLEGFGDGPEAFTWAPRREGTEAC